VRVTDQVAELARGELRLDPAVSAFATLLEPRPAKDGDDPIPSPTALVAAAQSAITMAHLRRAARAEYEAMGRVVRTASSL
jgi:hypothetical protein